MALHQKRYLPKEALVLLTDSSESNDDCSEDGDNELISEDVVEEIDEERLLSRVTTKM